MEIPRAHSLALEEPARPRSGSCHVCRSDWNPAFPEDFFEVHGEVKCYRLIGSQPSHGLQKSTAEAFDGNGSFARLAKPLRSEWLSREFETPGASVLFLFGDDLYHLNQRISETNLSD